MIPQKKGLGPHGPNPPIHTFRRQPETLAHSDRVVCHSATIFVRLSFGCLFPLRLPRLAFLIPATILPQSWDTDPRAGKVELVLK